MTAAPRSAHLQPVVMNDLPIYPIAPDERLDGNSFVKWATNRWLASKTFKLMPWDMQGMARALFDMCQNETPVGTLPDDDEELAFMLRCDARRVRELRGQEYGPLRNWSHCLCEGQSNGKVRLMHPVVLEQVRDALDRRALALLSKDEKAVAMRLDRLRKALQAQGCSKDVLADDVLINRMDEWLTATRKGKRTEAVYRSAILHAVENKWFGRMTPPS
jgi:hypothetical protein